MGLPSVCAMRQLPRTKLSPTIVILAILTALKIAVVWKNLKRKIDLERLPRHISVHYYGWQGAWAKKWTGKSFLSFSCCGACAQYCGGLCGIGCGLFDFACFWHRKREQTD